MYQFKLEALLSHRRHQEEVCQKQLARTERKLTAEKDKLQQLKGEMQQNVLNLQAKQKEPINVSEIIISFNYIKKLSNSIDEQKKRVRDATQDVDQKRHELIVNVKKRRTLEKLKENEQLAYRHKLMQSERKLMDEAASVRHARKV